MEFITINFNWSPATVADLNRCRWQVWTALLRGVVWDRFDLSTLLTFYGTAGERWRMRTQPCCGLAVIQMLAILPFATRKRSKKATGLSPKEPSLMTSTELPLTNTPTRWGT